VRGGIADILPLVTAADKPDRVGMSGWDCAMRIVRLSTAELGIDPRLLASVPVAGVVPLPPDQRPALIHQKRVEMFRAVSERKSESAGENRFDTGDGF
jgi:hypothetical protein